MTPLGLLLTAPARRVGVWRLALLCLAVTAATLVLLRLIGDLGAWLLRRRPVPLDLDRIGRLGAFPGRAGLRRVERARAAGGARCRPGSGAGAARLARQLRAPRLLAAVGVFALFDTATMALLPVYALRNGMGEAAAANAVGVLVIGNVVLQPALGWLADRWSRRRVLLGCALLTASGGAILPAATGSLLLWPLLFFWGAAGFGVYTIALADLGARFAGPMMVAGAAAFTAI